MSIITFLSMIFIVTITYLVQFFIVRFWITDYEKHNTKDIYKQISAFLNYNDSEYWDHLRYFDLDDTDIFIYDQNRNIIVATDDDDIDELYITSNPRKLEIFVRRIDGEEKVILNSPLVTSNGRYYLYIEKEIDIYEDFLEWLLPVVILSIVLITIMSLLAGMYISRKFVNRLKALKITMEKVRDSGVSNRVKITNKSDEFEKIGILFNSMMDEVEKSFNQQKQFVQDASHELRTPLTILKGHLQMLNRWGKNDKETLDKSLKIASEELERLIKLVNDLLSLNKMESYKSVDIVEDIDVNEVIESVIYGFNILSEDIQIEFYPKDKIHLRILREHLKQLIIIFIDNGIKYCDKKHKHMYINVYEMNKEVVISIKDNGIGIKKEDISKVTDKFYRVDESRKYNNSFGIGLSIASQLVKLYKGRLQIFSEYGEFTEVRVSFRK